MITDEQKLHKLTQASPQGHNPFRVPEGYFATLPTRVMDRIKESEQSTVKPEVASASSLSSHSKQERQWWVRLAVAAAFTGFFFVAGTMFYRSHHGGTSVPASNIASMSGITDTEYTDELLDYAMLSNSDIEYYLTSAD